MSARIRLSEPESNAGNADRARVRSARPLSSALAAKKVKKAAASKADKAPAKEKDNKPRSTREMLAQDRAEGKNSATPALAAARPVGPRVRVTSQSPAVTAFGKALERFRKQDWKACAEELQAGIEKFPGETEVLERMRSYLKICERNQKARPAEAKTPEEHYQRGVWRMNAGLLDEAIADLSKALSLASRKEAAHYVLACAHALKSDRAGALSNLRTAIEMNAENRIHAGDDSDFELVRDDAEFTELIGSRARD